MNSDYRKGFITGLAMGAKVKITEGAMAPMEKDVNFWDYDGTLVAGYTVAEAQALTALPTPCGHSGIIFDGWNWELSDVNALVGPMDIGACYRTDNGRTRLKIRLTAVTGYTGIKLCFRNGTTATPASSAATVYWGDGTTTTSNTHSALTLTHDYPDIGDYTIEISADYSYVLGTGLSSSDERGTVIGGNTPAQKGALISVALPYFSSGISISMGAFYDCSSLESLAVPSNIKLTNANAFGECRRLKYITVPPGYYIANKAFYLCSGLRRISFDKYAFSGTISNMSFYGCTSLEKIVLPGNVTSMEASAFGGTYSCIDYDFSNFTAIPTAGNALFANLPAICVMKIPSALIDSWKTATNWSAYADYMIPV